MSIASRINEITNHLTDDWQSIQNIGGDTSIDNNIENISQALEDLYDEMPKVSSSGTDLSLNDTRKGRLSLDLKGNTYQKTLPSGYTSVDYIESSGTQYIDTGYKHNTSKTSYELNISIDTLSNPFNTLFGARTTYNNSDAYYLGVKNDYSTFGCIGGNHQNSIGWNVSVGTKYNIIYNATGLIVDGTTYSMPSQSNTTCSYNDCIFALNEAGTIKEQIKCKLYSFVIKEDGKLVRYFVPCLNSNNEVGLYDLVNDTFYTNQGTGVFTYGTTSSIPNPDIPIPINVVSGDNEIVVGNKNLLPLIDGTTTLNGLTITINNSTITLNGSPNSSTIFKLTNGIEAYNSSQVKSDWLNETIIDNKNNTTWSLNYISGTGDTSGCAFRTFGNDSTYINQFYPTATSQNTTYNSSGKISCVVFFTASGKTFTNYKFSIQLERGNQASSFIPYQSTTYPISLGNMEVCKIGDYQDYIYKDNGKWYKYGMIGKVVLNGSENWSKYGAYSSPVYYLYYVSGVFNGLTDEDNNYGYGLSNCFQWVYGHYATGITYPYCRFKINDGTLLYIGFPDNLSLDDFKTWLSTHNTIVYYVLQTPTITEITDTILINQLNNIYKAQSYNEQTNINQTNNDLPFIINASALKEWSE